MLLWKIAADANRCLAFLLCDSDPGDCDDCCYYCCCYYCCDYCDYKLPVKEKVDGKRETIT